MKKVGVVGIIGRPNVGKSTLLNKVVGQKISITTPKPQTTRYNIRGIINNEDSQIVFVDTPGILEVKNKLTDYMNKGVNNTIKSVDVILLLVDATNSKIDNITKETLNNLIYQKKPIILCINKVDKVKKEKILEIMTMYMNFDENLKFKEIIPISVKQNDGIDLLISKLTDNLKEGEDIYLNDEFTEQTEREIVEETIREKLLRNLDEEVPHGMFVEVEYFKERVNVNGDLTYDIHANLICTRNSFKPIVIGENGSLLRHITNEAKIELAKILDVKIKLKLFVKVREDWEENENILKVIKYKNK